MSAESDITVEVHQATQVMEKEKRQRKHANPIIVLLSILLLASAMTYFVDSGSYQRQDGLVIPSSYQSIEKDNSPTNLLRTSENRSIDRAQAVSLIETLMAIPEGLEKTSGLIFMVLIIGGMFGVLSRSGAIDAGLERLLSLVNGNIYLLVPLLMVVFSMGSTFLGLASEYLLIIPVMVAMANRLGMSNLIGLAIVTVAAKVGYIASVTNPVSLTVAQPLVGLQIFSGSGFRLACYLVFLVIAVAFVLMAIRKEGFNREATIEFDASRLSMRHTAMLIALMLGIAFLVYASNQWLWKHHALSAYYIGLSMLLAAISGLGASESAEAFVDGMKKVLLASVLIGVASAVSVVLKQGQVLDSIVHSLTGMIGDKGATVSAIGMFFSQLLLDFVIPSTSGQAAVSMPILGPVGQLSGVQPQTTVLAFLFGNGLTNMFTPTSGTLLAYLATAQVGWSRWAKFIIPLWGIFIVTAMVLLALAVFLGY
jgi:uncharacterized ion transporter superfamily protein YfcC